jgi:hypothetical protein
MAFAWCSAWASTRAAQFREHRKQRLRLYPRRRASATRRHPAVPQDDALAGIQHDEAAVDEIEGAGGKVAGEVGGGTGHGSFLAGNRSIMPERNGAIRQTFAHYCKHLLIAYTKVLGRTGGTRYNAACRVVSSAGRAADF